MIALFCGGRGRLLGVGGFGKEGGGRSCIFKRRVWCAFTSIILRRCTQTAESRPFCPHRTSNALVFKLERGGIHRHSFTEDLLFFFCFFFLAQIQCDSSRSCRSRPKESNYGFIIGWDAGKKGDLMESLCVLDLVLVSEFIWISTTFAHTLTFQSLIPKKTIIQRGHIHGS